MVRFAFILSFLGLATTYAEQYYGPNEVFENRSLKIVCEGVRNDDIIWTVNDTLISGRFGINLKPGDESILRIPSVGESMSGKYRCLRNSTNYFDLRVVKDGCIGTSVVMVGDPWSIECMGAASGPSVKTILTTDYSLWLRSQEKIGYYGADRLFEGDGVTIDCVGFNSTDLIHWTKDHKSLGDELASGRNMRVTTSPLSSTLMIEHVFQSDQGTYSCIKGGDEGFTVSIRKGCVEQSADEHLECLTWYVGNYEWKRNGMNIDNLIQSGHMTVTNTEYNTTKLSVRRAMEDDAGLYQYVLKAAHHFLMVLKSNDEIYYNGVEKVFSGDIVNISCSGFKPNTKIEWKLNGHALINPVVITTKQQSILSVNASRDTGGNYTCSSSGKNFFRLQVEQGYYIGVTSVVEGQRWYIRCNPNTMTKVWMRDQVSLNETALLYTIHISNDSLSSEFALLSQTGDYTCSKDSTPFHLTVEPRVTPGPNELP